jgi:hypothetical protein
MVKVVPPFITLREHHLVNDVFNVLHTDNGSKYPLYSKMGIGILLQTKPPPKAIKLFKTVVNDTP